MTIPVRIGRKPKIDHDRQPKDRPGTLDAFSEVVIVVITETALGL